MGNISRGLSASGVRFDAKRAKLLSLYLSAEPKRNRHGSSCPSLVGAQVFQQLLPPDRISKNLSFLFMCFCGWLAGCSHPAVYEPLPVQLLPAGSFALAWIYPLDLKDDSVATIGRQGSYGAGSQIGQIPIFGHSQHTQPTPASTSRTDRQDCFPDGYLAGDL
jgi:hypothetical protein